MNTSPVLPNRFCFGSAPAKIGIYQPRPCRQSRNYEVVSIEKPEKGVCFNDFQGEFLPIWLLEEDAAESNGERGRFFKGSISEDPDDSDSDGVSQKVVSCSKTIGVSVDNSKGGWNQLIEFADKRERRRAGMRE